MQKTLHLGVSVLTVNGTDIGTLHHVVLDDRTHLVTAIVVERPLLGSGNELKPGGWSAPRDKRVEMPAVTVTDENRVVLSLTEREFETLRPYVLESAPESAGDLPPTLAAADMAMQASALLGGTPYAPPRAEVDNRGPNDYHLSAGAAVWRREPHVHIGDVDQVIMDRSTHAAISLVIRHGILLRHEVTVPMIYVVDVLDDLVHVDISEPEWHALAERRTD